MSCVTVKVPWAPQPLACMRRSGITSRSKCAIFSISQISCSSAGPRRPAVMMLVLSATGDPVALANGFVLDMVGSWVLDMVVLCSLCIGDAACKDNGGRCRSDQKLSRSHSNHDGLLHVTFATISASHSAIRIDHRLTVGHLKSSGMVILALIVEVAVRVIADTMRADELAIDCNY